MKMEQDRHINLSQKKFSLSLLILIAVTFTAHAQTVPTRDSSDKPYDWHQLPQQQMIHMAAAILALNPPPGFTATLLNETTVTLKISVTDNDEKRGGTFGSGMCGDSFALAPTRGWPQPYTYVVEEQWKSQNSTERVLIPGEPAITARRALSNSSCSTLSGFTSVQRLLLAEQEADLSSSTLRTGTLQYDTLRYPGPANYLAALSALVTRHKEPFQRLAATLADKSFLTTTEAKTTIPIFSVEIEDQRQNQIEPLPLPNTLGARVIIGPYKPETGSFIKQ